MLWIAVDRSCVGGPCRWPNSLPRANAHCVHRRLLSRGLLSRGTGLLSRGLLWGVSVELSILAGHQLHAFCAQDDAGAQAPARLPHWAPACSRPETRHSSPKGFGGRVGQEVSPSWGTPGPVWGLWSSLPTRFQCSRADHNSTKNSAPGLGTISYPSATSLRISIGQHDPNNTAHCTDTTSLVRSHPDILKSSIGSARTSARPELLVHTTGHDLDVRTVLPIVREIDSCNFCGSHPLPKGHEGERSRAGSRFSTVCCGALPMAELFAGGELSPSLLIASRALSASASTPSPFPCLHHRPRSINPRGSLHLDDGNSRGSGLDLQEENAEHVRGDRVGLLAAMDTEGLSPRADVHAAGRLFFGRAGRDLFAFLLHLLELITFAREIIPFCSGANSLPRANSFRRGPK